MYKLFTPLWLLLWLSGQIGSQSYTFSVDSETYIDLDGGLALTGTSNWGRDVDLEIDIPLGFTFSLFGRPIDTLYYFHTDLYTSPERSDGIINCDALVASTSSLADRGSVNDGDSQSPITYHLTGDAPARIGIIEWENAGYRDDISDNDASAAYTNFQIWLYEKSGTIELHYGPNSPGELDGVDIIEPGVIMIKDYYYNPDSDSLSWTELFYL
ncbi:MAG: hypothetical protein WA952_18820, partial [Lewinella sp.]